MDETEDLIQLCVRALAAQMIAAPGAELHMTRTCILGLTDEPLADHNRLTLGPNPDVEGFLIRSVARARERDRPLTAIMSPHVAQALAPVATGLGLTAVGTSPLMVLRPDGRSIRASASSWSPTWPCGSCRGRARLELGKLSPN